MASRCPTTCARRQRTRRWSRPRRTSARSAVRASRARIPPKQMYLTSTYSSMPYLLPSRPSPDCLTPPNGATCVVMRPVLTPTMPASSCSAMRQRGRCRGCRSTTRGRTRCRWRARTTSASSLKRISGATGPKVSSREDLHLARDVRQHRRLVEVAAQRVPLAAQRDLARRAPSHRRRAPRPSPPLRALMSGPCVTPASVPGADLELRHALRELRRERVVDLVLHEQAVRAHARLARVAVLGDDRALRRGIEIGVVEHDERRVAAELERELLDRRRDLLHQHAADFGRAGERELAHGRVRAHLAADLRGLADDDVEHAGRKARAMRELGERQRRVRRRFRGLDHDGAARGERGRHLARDHRAREIPRRDRRAHADRLLHDDEAAIAADRRDHVAVDALAFLGEPLDVRGADRDLRLRLRRAACPARWSGSARDRRRAASMRSYHLRTIAQRSLASMSRHAGQCALGGFDRAARLGRAADGHGADGGAGRGIGHRARAAVVGVDPLSRDEALVRKSEGSLSAGDARSIVSGAMLASGRKEECEDRYFTRAAAPSRPRHDAGVRRDQDDARRTRCGTTRTA